MRTVFEKKRGTGMSEKNVVIPEGMLKAASAALMGGPGRLSSEQIAKLIVPVVLRWLRENPPTPTGRQIQEMSDSLTAQGDNYHSTEAYCREWIRHMFNAP